MRLQLLNLAGRDAMLRPNTIRTAAIAVLAGVTVWRVWTDDPSSYLWLGLTLLAMIMGGIIEAGPATGIFSLRSYRELGLSLLALLIGGHSLLFYGFPITAIVALVLGLVVVIRVIGGAQLLLVNVSLLGVTLALNVFLHLTGLAGAMYYRPHEMLASYDERFGPVYRPNGHVTMRTPHGDIQAIANVGVYEPREEIFITDSLGFRNARDYRGERYVLVGDSFIAGNGNTQACLLSEELRRAHGVETYNLGYMGDLAAYSRRIKGFQAAHGPDFQVLLFVFEGNDFVRWDEIGAPSTTSGFGYKAFFQSTSLWRYSRWLYRRLSRAESEPSPVVMLGGAPMAFYSGYREVVLHETEWDEAQLRFAAMFKDLHDRIAHIFFIPEKYRVYHSLLPGAGGAALPNKQWDYLERSARQAGIPVTNLTGPLTGEARRLLPAGRYVYWRDDSHWNCDGVAVAARMVAAALEATPPRLLVRR